MSSPTVSTAKPGAGPITPQTASQAPDILIGTFGLSSQLIIWGMVGFILLELIAVICLLRYCCRARYLRKRKYKEKELILADRPNDISKIFYHRDKVDYSQNPTDLTTSASNMNTPGGAVVNSSIERQSTNSLRPILLNQTQHDPNETIMVDDIMSIYSSNIRGKQPRLNQANPNQSVIELEIAKSPKFIDTLVNIPIDVESRRGMRHQEPLSAEDIYTLRFATTSNTEPLEDTSVPRLHQSYLYNGSINQPAFEVISHADVRPATPIHYEQVRELHLDTDQDEQQHQRRRSARSRANTTPLHYGNQESVRNAGEPVQWQVARELRANNDFDYLKSFGKTSTSRPHTPGTERRSLSYANMTDTELYSSGATGFIINKTIYPGGATRTFVESTEHFDTFDTFNNNVYNGSTNGGGAKLDMAADAAASNNRIYSSDTNLLEKTSCSSSCSSSANNIYEKFSVISNYTDTKYSGQDIQRVDEEDQRTAAKATQRPALLTKIVRDFDTNEILSVKRMEMNDQHQRPYNNSNNNNHKNVSVINVKSTFNDLDIGALPPPAPFRESFASSGSQPTHEAFLSTNEINLNLDHELASLHNQSILSSAALPPPPPPPPPPPNMLKPVNSTPLFDNIINEIKQFNSCRLRPATSTTTTTTTTTSTTNSILKSTTIKQHLNETASNLNDTSLAHLY